MRILIIGASGSGTSTLGKTIASEYDWSFCDADDYYWLPTTPPFQEKRDHTARLEMMLNDINGHGNAVVSGSIMNWGIELENSFDLIVFLYLETNIRVKRVKKREESRFGLVDPKFLKWLSEYDTGPSEGRSLAKHNAWLGERKARVIRIEGDLTVQERVAIVRGAFPLREQAADAKSARAVENVTNA